MGLYEDWEALMDDMADDDVGCLPPVFVGMIIGLVLVLFASHPWWLCTLFSMCP